LGFKRKLFETNADKTDKDQTPSKLRLKIRYLTKKSTEMATSGLDNANEFGII